MYATFLGDCKVVLGPGFIALLLGLLDPRVVYLFVIVVSASEQGTLG